MDVDELFSPFWPRHWWLLQLLERPVDLRYIWNIYPHIHTSQPTRRVRHIITHCHLKLDDTERYII